MLPLFLRNALLASLLVSVASGVVGAYVVVKRIVSIGGGISHATFGGIGLGILLGLNPLLTAIPFSLASALAMALITRRGRVSEDAAIGILWATGMALGVLFISLRRGYVPELSAYLFGSILTVPTYELQLMAALDLIILMVVAFFFRELLHICFDEEFSEVVGVPVEPLYIALLCLISLSVIVLVRAVGVILTIALLSIPSSISLRLTHSLKGMMILSTLLSLMLLILGLALSYLLDLPPGALTVLLSIGAFTLSSLKSR
ncbi:MAG TPA: metal ABC transporter permease [Candidatus Bathyarchaeota archaeon]|nr:metal ABC transporter permease [Candidatus Bathyarchaeota archaeon]